MEVVKHLDGAYALLIKSTAYPGELVACKRGSPLILGIKVACQPAARSADTPRVQPAQEHCSQPNHCNTPTTVHHYYRLQGCILLPLLFVPAA